MESKLFGFSRDRVRYNLLVALDALAANKIKTWLTTLGILFGVTSVIAMMAVGRGARQEVISQIEAVGSNNIIIRNLESASPVSKTAVEEETRRPSPKYSPGLNLSDAISLREIFPEAKISIEHKREITACFSTNLTQTELTGVDETYFSIFNLMFFSGSAFNSQHNTFCRPVCILGADLRKFLFKTENPMGKMIKCDDSWFEVIGVLEARAVNKEGLKDYGIESPDNKIYIPSRTMLLLHNGQNHETAGQNLSSVGGYTSAYKNIYSAPVDKIIVQVESTDKLNPATEIIRRMLQRKHFGVEDYAIIIPWELLKQKERTKQIFNLVLGLIAGISLLVGGIGIMNIMYASVLERTREIGVRMAIGARTEDIALQFLAEAILLSLSGGMIGIISGFGLCIVIQHLFGITTIITFSSILLAFSVAFIIGVVFGYYPARKASMYDPIEALRHE